MIIGIDGNEANVERRVGISEYAYQLLRQFSSFAEESEKSGSKVRFRIYLKSKPLGHMPKESAHWQYRIVTPGKLWTQWRLPLDLYWNRPRPNVFFSPTHYAPRFSPVPTVMSVMDLSYLYFPELFNKSDLYQLRNWTAYSVKNAKKVLTISNSSRDDIIKEYAVKKDKVVAIHPGIKETISLKPHVFSMNQLKAKYGISDNFILFVGTLQPRKNITRLIEAFSQIVSNDPQMNSNKLDKDSGNSRMKDLQLIVVGKKGWLYESILQTPQNLGIEDKVKFLEDVSDDELSLFYKHALCYVLPSLYEGFGLPVLEAMQHGCPVITSKISSLPEAGGDAALYVDPGDIKDIAEKMTQVITNEKLRDEMREKGKIQVRKFSWEKTARATLDVLQEVAK
jgi:glycosyltransferase involved in cell wall biosynthesis